MARTQLFGPAPRSGTWEFVTPTIPEAILTGRVGVHFEMNAADHDDLTKGFVLNWWSSPDGLVWRHEGGMTWDGGPAYRIIGGTEGNRITEPVYGCGTGAINGERLRGRIVRVVLDITNGPIRMSANLDTPD